MLRVLYHGYRTLLSSMVMWLGNREPKKERKEFSVFFFVSFKNEAWRGRKKGKKLIKIEKNLIVGKNTLIKYLGNRNILF